MINKIQPTITIEGKQLEINELIADLQTIANGGATHIVLSEEKVYNSDARYDHIKVLKGMTIVAKKAKKTRGATVDWTPEKGWTVKKTRVAKKA